MSVGISPTIPNPYAPSRIAPQNPETWFSDFKKNWLSDAWVKNSTPYLTQWGLANAANSAFNSLDSYDKDTAQAVSSVFVIMSVFIDILGTQSGCAALVQREKYLESLSELVTDVNQGGLTAFQLAEKVAKCAKDLQAAESLPGWSEFIPKIGTDAIAGVNSLMQQINTYITIANNRSVAEALGSALIDKHDNLHILQKNSEVPDLKKISDANTNADALTDKAGEHHANLANPSNVVAAANGIGMITGLANVARGIAEIPRLYRIGKSHHAKIQIVDRGIAELQGEIGTEILKNVKKTTQHRNTANLWSLVGALFRIGNGLWGIASKIVFFALGTVISSWIAPFVAALVFLAYALKGWMNTRHTRSATRLDNLLTNTIKVLSRAGSEPYEKYLKPELVKDLNALAQGGRELWNFLKTLGRPELFSEVTKLFEEMSNIKDRFPLVKKIIDICTTPTDIVRQVLRKSANADDVNTADALSRSDLQDMEEPEALSRNTQELQDGFPLEYPISSKRFNVGEEKMFQKFMSSPLEKAIASSAGQLPGWRFSSGDKVLVQKMSIESIKARAGDTPETDLLLGVMDGLNRNGKTRNGKVSTFFSIAIKSRTWSLTKHAKDCQNALEDQDPTKLATTTLVAALTESNVEAIARCRFTNQPMDQETLLKLLSTKPNFSEIKAIAKAIEEGDGKRLPQMSMNASFQNSLKIALMLFGHRSELADGITAILCSSERPMKSANTADDWINALGILTGKQMFAKIKNENFRDQVRQHLVLFGVSKFLATKSSPHMLTTIQAWSEDRALRQYIDGIATGKIPFSEVPEKLLSPALRDALGKTPKAALRQALREQLLLNFRFLDGEERAPLSMRWPELKFYGPDPSSCTRSLEHSFRTLLNIEIHAGKADDMLNAARLYQGWHKENPPIHEIKKILLNGGVCAAVALHCITGRQGIPVLDAESLRHFSHAKSMDDFKTIYENLFEKDDVANSEESNSSMVTQPNLVDNASVNEFEMSSLHNKNPQDSQIFFEKIIIENEEEVQVNNWHQQIRENRHRSWSGTPQLKNA